ncbi:MAG: chemotaxis protein CheW [Cyanobacteria bacterium CRU_2_1]|nr:chemotaxis protein CheW [Cyanobacteria bacterium RU_5_0]NJR60101.1 chemotaxis protein CheW [Cyanobacteria bacterium CRU_2_1]
MHSKANSSKFIVFKIAEYHFGIPVDRVLQVINYASETNKELNSMGLIQISNHTIRILNLHQRLNSENQSRSLNQPFLVIIQNTQEELCAIPVDTPPDLMEFSSAIVRPLPPTNHPSNLAELASHIITLTQKEITTIVFLLDMQKITDLILSTDFANFKVCP